MADNPSKLQNIQLPAQAGDSLATGVVETNGLDRGQIDGSGVPGASKEGVERRACDCEHPFGGVIACGLLGWLHDPEKVYCRKTKRNLP